MPGESSCEMSGMPSSSGKTSRAVCPSGCVIVAPPSPARPCSAGRLPPRGARSAAGLPVAPGAMRTVLVLTRGARGACGRRSPGSRAHMSIGDGVQRIGEPVRRWARTQKQEYAQGSDRPLAGDLGAMGVYAGLVAAGAAAVRASGRELPTRVPLGDAVLLTVATFRLARRIAKDPVTAPVRAPFTSYQGTSGHAEIAEEVREHGGVKHAVGELLTCPFCLAQWVGTAFV